MSNEIKKCCTIYINRRREEILDYQRLFDQKILSGVEIFFPYNLSDQRQEEYTQALKVLRGHQEIEFVLHLPYGPLNNLATHVNLEPILKRMNDAIKWAHQFQVRKLTLHPGDLDGTINRLEAINLAIDNIRQVASWAEDYGMVIVLENLIGQNELCVTPEEIYRFLTEVDRPNVKFNLDCGHAFVSGNRDLAHFVHVMKDFLYHLHLNDNNGMDDQHFPIGQGKIDFLSYFKALKNIGYHELFCIEAKHKDAHEMMNQALELDRLWDIANK